MKKKNIILLVVGIIIVLVIGVIFLINSIQKKAINSALEASNRNYIFSYVDKLKLQVIENTLEDSKWESSKVNKEWAKEKVKNSNVDCKEIYYSEIHGIVLHDCSVDGKGSYFYAKDIYTKQEDAYKNIYNSVK